MPECNHCLLSFPEREAVYDEIDGNTLVFCCNGCRGIYGLIHDEGLERFYDKREWQGSAAGASPLVTSPDPGLFDGLVRDIPPNSPEEDTPLKEIDIYIGNIRCASCIWLNERILHKTDGVVYARLNYATHMARIRWNPQQAGIDTILNRIASIGYIPRPYTETERYKAQRAEARDLLVRFGTAAFLSSNLMIYSVALYAGYFQGLDGNIKLFLEVVSLFLTIPVIFYSGMPFIKSTIRGLRSLSFTMDSLITAGSGSAFIYSIYSLFTGSEVYFDTAAMIITLILLGRYIETVAKAKASMTIRMLSELIPKEARRLRAGDQPGDTPDTEMISVASVMKGDSLLVRPGERIPLDGIVTSGESEVDESVITGESKPVVKTAGLGVIGGSTNLFGSVVFEVRSTDKDTVLSKIIESVSQAQATKPRIQNTADRIVAIFVPAIISISFLTVLFHLIRGASPDIALMTGVSVLVIACPCSLGLSTPLAVMICSAIASSKGILLKNGDVIENVVRLSGVVFDKTGTITIGKPVLKKTLAVDPSMDAEELLKIAASLERFSEHSAGHAIMEAAKGMAAYEVSGFKAIPGKGVAGELNGIHTFVGNSDFMAQKGIAVSEELKSSILPFEAEGHTAVYTGWDERLRGIFLVADSVREDAAGAVGMIRDMGLGTAIISGDTVTTTRAIAAAVGISDVTGGALPTKKRELIADLQKGNGRIMMVGDGINDAPALTEAFVGIGMGRGTEIAMESADAILVRNSLEAVPFFIGLCRKSLRIIKQNIFWAFFYNMAAIPLAISGVLHPIVAAGAMSASSLFVVFNSLRIRRCGQHTS
ncbi:MAG: heavy metal translocating P-type ATPase [Deltaproteobacteria bacterium]|nr:heavy metal translocating P-type ATPase [Deltaproteobacteria bacterium]